MDQRDSDDRGTLRSGGYLWAPTSRVAEMLGTLGAFAILGGACVTVVDVLMRWLLGSNVVAINEIISLTFAVAIAACLPAGVLHGRNLTVDLLQDALPRNLRQWCGTGGNLLLLIFLAVLSWQMFRYAGILYHQGRTTIILGVSVVPFIYAVAAIVGFSAFVQIFRTYAAFSAALAQQGGWQDGSRKVGISMIVFLAAIAVLLLYIAVDFPTIAGWTRANGGLAVIISFLIMWGLLLAGVPIAAAIGLVGLVGIATAVGWAPALSVAATESIDFLSNSQVSTLPLFLMMGSFAAVAGVSDDLYRLAQVLLGGFRGGLALATIGGCGGFSAVTGSSLATTAIFGRVALPEMQRRGYSPALSTGTVAAGGTLGALIPPSSPLILYALLTESSIGELFIAAIVPGLIAILFYFIVIAIYVRVAPGSAPAPERANRGEIWYAVKRSGAVVALFGTVIGGLYFGIFTPNEAAAVGAIAAFLLALVRGRLSRANFFSAMSETMGTTALIYGLIFGALIFSFFVAVSGVPETTGAFVRSLDFPPIVLIAILLVIFLLLGCVMDSFAVMIITIPIVTPLVLGMGYDLIWWGIINLIIIETGMITPPFGIHVFVLKSVAPKVPLMTIYRGAAPFVLADLIKLALLVAFPIIVLALPNSM